MMALLRFSCSSACASDLSSVSFSSRVASAAAASLRACFATFSASFAAFNFSDKALTVTFEVGPVEGEWKGGMFGVSEGGAIQQHGVGKANELPKKTILEYPIDDIKAEVGGHEFNAVACQNKLEPTTSYFIQAQGHPQHLMFGGHPEDEDAEAWVVTLA